MKGYGTQYVTSLYEIYDMQEYLQKYLNIAPSSILHFVKGVYQLPQLILAVGFNILP